jgi:acetyl-CoA carboxylase biotin carboxyl carrier protein
MTLKELREMINLMEEYGLSELEVEKEGLKIRLKRGQTGKIVQEALPYIPPRTAYPARDVHVPPAGHQMGRDTMEQENVVVVRSPMVGTFYAAPGPDALPYVAKGKSVSEGDVLCIIEAMKLMNEIKSDLSGTVLDVLVQNGQPVEFDQPMFKIQKA